MFGFHFEENQKEEAVEWDEKKQGTLFLGLVQEEGVFEFESESLALKKF